MNKPKQKTHSHSQIQKTNWCSPEGRRLQGKDEVGGREQVVQTFSYEISHGK